MTNGKEKLEREIELIPLLINNQRVMVTPHPTDYIVVAQPEQIKQITKLSEVPQIEMEPVSSNVVRIRLTKDTWHGKFIQAMSPIFVINPVYLIESTNEELIIDDRLLLHLIDDNEAELNTIIKSFNLIKEDKMGSTFVMKLLPHPNQNTLDVAKEISQAPYVASCSPNVRPIRTRFG